MQQSYFQFYFSIIIFNSNGLSFSFTQFTFLAKQLYAFLLRAKFAIFAYKMLQRFTIFTFSLKFPTKGQRSQIKQLDHATRVSPSNQFGHWSSWPNYFQFFSTILVGSSRIKCFYPILTSTKLQSQITNVAGKYRGVHGWIFLGTKTRRCVDQQLIW